MCVIFLAEDARPSDEQVELAYFYNDKGGGAMWRQEGRVHYAKGKKVEEMVELAQTLPLPFALHFRIPSCGGDQMRLNHPFPVARDVKLDMTGNTNGALLMHNGHWGMWQAELKDAVYKGHLKMPDGPWSDTRAMAFLASHFGLGYLELVDEKILVMTPDKIKVYGKGWEYINNGSLLVSNRYWEFRQRTVHKASNFTTPPASLLPTKREKTVYDFKDDKEEKETREAALRLLHATDPSSLAASLATGGLPLDEQPFRSGGSAQESGAPQQESLQAVEETPRPPTGQRVEEIAQGGTAGTEEREGGGGPHAEDHRSGGRVGSYPDRATESYRSVLGVAAPWEDNSLDPRTRAVMRADWMRDQAMARWARKLNPKESGGGSSESEQVATIPAETQPMDLVEVRRKMHARGIRFEGPL